MAESVGELFVRIRPAPGSQAAFETEAAGGMKSAGMSLGKVFGAAFALGAAGLAVKSIASAAINSQAAFAVLETTVKNAGASNELYGKSIESVLKSQSRLKGFSDTELASAFVRLVSATKNSEQAYKDLGLAEDVARARHIGVEQAALAVSKAEQGSATALQRLGIVVPQVTAAVDAVKAKREAAVIAGAKFTESEKAQWAAAILTAQAQDKQATRLQALNVIQERFGGSAATFANTSAGQFARLAQDLEQFKEALGTSALPVLATGAEDAGKALQFLSDHLGARSRHSRFSSECSQSPSWFLSVAPSPQTS